MIMCERFDGLTPLQTNEYSAEEFFKLIKNLNAYKDNREENEAGTAAAGRARKRKSYMVKVTE